MRHKNIKNLKVMTCINEKIIQIMLPLHIIYQFYYDILPCV